MSGVIAAGLIGGHRHSEALDAHGAPAGRVRVVAQAGPGDAGALVRDAALRAVLVFAPPAERAHCVVAALNAGKIVLCPPPVAMSDDAQAAVAAAARAGSGVLLNGGEIAHGEAGRHGLAAIRAPEFGRLRTLWLAIRQARGGEGDVLEEPAWEACDFVAALTGDAPVRARVNAGALFGAARDAAAIVLRSGEVVVSMELARCLPAGLVVPGLGEIEAEAVGTGQAVRVLPSADAVRIERDGERRLAPWLNAPVVNMLRAIEAAADGQVMQDGVAQAARTLRLMQAIRAAA